MTEKRIRFEIDFGSGPHERSLYLRDTVFVPTEIGRVFGQAKEMALAHWARVELTGKLNREPTEIEIGVALGRLSRDVALSSGTSAADLAIVENL